MTREEGVPALPEPLDAAAALAGTVAHDLGNMLTVILGNSELLLEGLADRPDLAECATLILQAAQKGTDLTERLDRLARRILPPAAPTDPAAVLMGFAKRVAGALPEGVTLELAIPEALPKINLPPAALVTALDEVVRNALAALVGGGCIRLAAMASGDRLRIVLEDDGPGMAPETLRRVTELGFTSGVAGHKTGVGLAVARRVASAGGGSLFLESRAEGGTRVVFDLATIR